MNETVKIENQEAHDKVVELLNDGMTLGKIEAYLTYEHDMTTGERKNFLAEIKDELGMESRRGGTADWKATVTYLRENFGKVEKKKLVEGMCEVNGKTFLTNQHAYNYIAMAQEWASQEAAE